MDGRLSRGPIPLHLLGLSVPVVDLSAGVPRGRPALWQPDARVGGRVCGGWRGHVCWLGDGVRRHCGGRLVPRRHWLRSVPGNSSRVGMRHPGCWRKSVGGAGSESACWREQRHTHRQACCTVRSAHGRLLYTPWAPSPHPGSPHSSDHTCERVRVRCHRRLRLWLRVGIVQLFLPLLWWGQGLSRRRQCIE